MYSIYTTKKKNIQLKYKGLMRFKCIVTWLLCDVTVQAKNHRTILHTVILKQGGLGDPFHGTAAHLGVYCEARCTTKCFLMLNVVLHHHKGCSD